MGHVQHLVGEPYVAWGLWLRTGHALWGQDPPFLLTDRAFIGAKPCYRSRGIKDMLIALSSLQHTAHYTPAPLTHSPIHTHTMCRKLEFICRCTHPVTIIMQSPCIPTGTAFMIQTSLHTCCHLDPKRSRYKYVYWYAHLWCVFPCSLEVVCAKVVPYTIR